MVSQQPRPNNGAANPRSQPQPTPGNQSQRLTNGNQSRQDRPEQPQRRRRTRPTRRPAGHGTADSAAAQEAADSATKQQMGQTFSIALIAGPANLLVFPLPIPLGIALLVASSKGCQVSTRPVNDLAR
ncbi:hypothetical protein GQ53DRAFT_828817 [Thozetella sp. PMI_491]|nr:hypothetical protein GQ53DRAFT_828817 [Thozetella sp. PMI_491]